MATQYRFDDRNISWAPFQGFEGLHYHLLEVDEDRQQVDMLMKFDAEARCIPHRHVGPTRTLVIAGEHRIYRTDGRGEPTQVRNAGAFATNQGDESHVEGAGPDGAVILLSMQAIDGCVWELMDEALCVYRRITLADFQRGLEKQKARAARPRDAR